MIESSDTADQVADQAGALTPEQIEALDRDNNGKAGGSLPKRKGRAVREPGDWQPPQLAEDGTALQGESGLPANHRLRAEALVAQGATSDPDGIITDALIADTAVRLAAEQE